MKTRALMIGFVVMLFWMAPSPSQSQARMPHRDLARTTTPTTQPDQAK